MRTRRPGRSRIRSARDEGACVGAGRPGGSGAGGPAGARSPDLQGHKAAGKARNDETLPIEAAEVASSGATWWRLDPTVAPPDRSRRGDRCARSRLRARPPILLYVLRRTQSRDTSPEIERRQIDAWRAMSEARKLAIASELTLAAEELTRAGIRERHPSASEREIALRLGALRLDRDTMIRVFGWDPEQQGY